MQLGLSQEDISARTQEQVSQRTVSALETGTTLLEKMAVSRVIGLASALSWTVQQMQEATGIDLGSAAPRPVSPRGQTLSPVPSLHRVPVIGLAAAGAPVSDEEDERIIGWEYPTDNEYRPHMLCLEVDGESMNNGDADGMRHGDRLYVDPTDMQLQENKIYVVHLHGNGIVVKRARRLATDWWLFSDNTDYKPTRPDEATVIGRVYYHQPRGKRL
ncbi:LexA family transcriptional regulator [Deinococcus sp. RIT780]|nr:LexA family transcriptional regulator [Deinococcus sp. RIT780]